jgi:hypothetical protein
MLCEADGGEWDPKDGVCDYNKKGSQARSLKKLGKNLKVCFALCLPLTGQLSKIFQK